MADIGRAEGSSRKRQKTSRDDTGPALKRHLPTDSPTIGEGSSAMAQRRAQSQSQSCARQTSIQAQPHVGDCHHEAALKSLHSDVSAMRDLVTCQVCHRFMYEPFQLSCGHTYCYTCLSQWLGSNHKKTCPDCRAHIHQQPTSSYIIRELVLIFVSRNQLLPDGETAEEHHTMAQEEAALVAKDKANKDSKTGGLFKGIFNRGAHGHLMPMRDPIDGVDRCPTCHWEVEDGYCNQCGLPVGEGFSDFDEDESDDDLSELDEDVMPHDDMDAFGVDHADIFGMHDGNDMDIDPAVLDAAFGGPPARRPMHNRINRHRAYSPINVDTDISDDSEDDDDEHNSEMDDFIDDDENQAGATYDDSSEDTEVQILNPRSRRRRPVSTVVISDDEGNGSARNQAISVEDSSSEESDNDDVPIAVSSRRSKPVQSRLANRRRPITVDSEDDESSGESDDEQHQTLTDTSTARGSSPVASTNADNDDDLDDDDDTSTRYGSEAPSSVTATYNHGELESSEFDSDDEEDRWDADQVFRPLPQSLRDPRNRLQTMQQRRSRTMFAPASARHVPPPYFGAAVARSTRGGVIPPLPARGLFTAAPAFAPPRGNRPDLDTHPFNLGNTLRAINNRGDRQSEERVGRHSDMRDDSRPAHGRSELGDARNINSMPLGTAALAHRKRDVERAAAGANSIYTQPGLGPRTAAARSILAAAATAEQNVRRRTREPTTGRAGYRSDRI